jgi:hypothetical protein
MTTYTIETITTRETGRQTRRLGPRPRRQPERRRRAKQLLSAGVVSLAAVALAWYGGDVLAARAEIYQVRRRHAHH